jgi:hypothetical protein
MHAIALAARLGRPRSYRSHRGRHDSFVEGPFRPDRPSSTSVSLERPLAHLPRESKSTSPKAAHRPAQWPRIQCRQHPGPDGRL